MLVYLFLFLLVLSQVLISDVAKYKSHDKIMKIIIFAYIVILVGVRHKVGVDTYSYMNVYDSIPKLYDIDYSNIFSYKYQPLFLLLESFCKTFFSSDFYWVQIFHALILNLSIFRFIEKNTEHFFTGLIFYLLTFFMYFNFEIMKESLAIAVFLLNFDALKENKWKRYYFGVFIAVLFHLSAGILIFLPFLKRVKFNGYFILSMAVFVILLIAVRPYLELLEFNEKLSNKVNTYVGLAESGILNMNWVLLQILQITIIPLFLLIISPKQKISHIVYLLCIYILLGLGTIFYQIIFLRLTNYFVPFVVLNCIYLITDIKYSPIRKRFFTFFSVLLFCIFYNYNFLSHGGIVRWFPYQSIFNPKVDKERDAFYYKFN